MPQRLGSVAASSAKRLEKKGDKSVDVQFDVLGRDAVVDVEPFCNLGVHMYLMIERNLKIHILVRRK